MKNYIVPSIIAKTQQEMEDIIGRVKDHTEYIQLDIMDGKFVPNTSIHFDFHLPEVECMFEAHLMVNDPAEWIRNHGKKVDIIIPHIESCKDVGAVLGLIKKEGKKAGLAINPGTPVENLTPYLEHLDQVIVMTVEPGAYGAKFIPESLDKVRRVRELAPNIEIEVDGGIKINTIHQAYMAGANRFVSGSYIVKADDVGAAIAALKKEVDEGAE
ncbi:TPA: ribulose-phosphate 3-epimerase [Candidatus Woesearchaeota archaeon]|nr:ribulose-phosphate 3-epimerase [Candidatus Woesearchaeota archaeon]